MNRINKNNSFLAIYALKKVSKLTCPSMLTYFAKYVNLNSKVSQHTFFRHFWLLWGKSVNTFYSTENPSSFLPILSEEIDVCSIRKIRMQYPLFESIN